MKQENSIKNCSAIILSSSGSLADKEIFALPPRTRALIDCMHVKQSRRKTSLQIAFEHEQRSVIRVYWQ